MDLITFNTLERGRAVEAVRPCLDVDRWVETILAGRPYANLPALEDVAATAALPMSDNELAAALTHHPRIGERLRGSGAEAALARTEQSGLPSDEPTQQRLREGNLAYEEKFGHVFLIRAAGRTIEEILAQLEERLGHDAQTEKQIVAQQLHQIAALRLKGIVQP